jgi:hypothetical protein
MKFFLLLFLLPVHLISFSQQRIQVNYGVDTSNTDNKAILSKWRKYIIYDSDLLYREKQNTVLEIFRQYLIKPCGGNK